MKMATETELSSLCTLQTEQQNPRSEKIDQVSTLDFCHIINQEDALIAPHVRKCLPAVASAIDALTERVRQGGRVIYVGAGTSGRLGILDASEIPPTYSAPEGQFVGLIAGGDAAIRSAQEGAEDSVDGAIHDLRAVGLHGRYDSVVGLAASGRTPYVLSCLSYAKQLGCVTVGVSCTAPSAMSLSGSIDHMINAVVGPEAITGSTRMKAGTATKMVLNMLSTGIMIKLGKTYGNMMVDVKATNQKLEQRSRNIIRSICGPKCRLSDSELDALLQCCDGSVKVAIAALSLNVTVAEAQKHLREANGLLARVLKETASIDEATSRPNGTSREYVLCIDAGGSKCAAAITSIDGASGYGEAEGCNVSDVGFDVAVESISMAVMRACHSIPQESGRPWQDLKFSRIWVGLAGYDRAALTARIEQRLEELFSRRIGPGLRVSNDLELLAKLAGDKYDVDSVIVLVAGTGSVAMSYRRNGANFDRVHRAGGWGYMLGDDGSGYDMGRKALRHALANLDINRARPSINGVMRPHKLDLLTQRILNHLQPGGPEDGNFDLLSAVLTGPSEAARKRSIAQIARVVMDMSIEDSVAREIVSAAVQSLADLLRPLLPLRSDEDEQRPVLVLTGGLMGDQKFQNQLKEAISNNGNRFEDVQVVNQPAVTGARYLAAENPNTSS